MKNLLLLSLVLLFTINCGKSSFSTENDLPAVTVVDEELTEIGDIEDGTVELSSGLEDGDYEEEIMKGLDMDVHEKCRPFAKRAYRKMLTLIKRQNRYDNTGDDIHLVRNQITKQRLDRIVRKMIKYYCLPVAESYEFNRDGETLIYNLGDNHLVNGSFEVIKLEGRKTRLEDGWTILNSHNVPGWKIENVYDNEETLTCNYLEIQTSGVVTQSADGRQHAELDSHCTNENGQKRRGDATIQISQSFCVTQPGTYSLRMKAQRRGGRYGELEVAMFQRKRDKSFQGIDLNNQASWNNVCVEYEVSDINKNVKIALRDSDNEDRETFGIILDDVQFVRGGCGFEEGPEQPEEY